MNEIIHSDCLEGLKTLDSESVDCCITSPPYWGLRDYGVDGQLGNEGDFMEFISKLIIIYKEVYRILKPEGTCYVNLGDTYMGGTAGSGGNCGKHIESGTNKYAKSTRFNNGVKKNGLPNKSLALIPERFAIEMISNGWILRNQIIWHKPNQMPSSATDRFTVDFEKIFFFVKQKNYYFEQQLEESIWAKTDSRFINGASTTGEKTQTGKYAIDKGGAYRDDGMKNMRTVWSINTKPFADAHFATFPEKLVSRMVSSGCPKGGVVLDPFMGLGTTAVVARKLGRNYIGFELNKEYIDIANKRLYNELGMYL